MAGCATAQLERQLTIPPPNYAGPSHNSHAVAHASLEALQEAGDPQFLFLRTILEHPTSEELLFHCITGSRHVILTRWDNFSEIFICNIRDFFMAMGDYCTSKTIRLACFTSSVAFWKRQWNNDKENLSSPSSSSSPVRNNNMQPSIEEQQILKGVGESIPRLSSKIQLFQYLTGHMTTHMESTCEYLSTLVGEFSGKSIVSYRLPMEFHKEAYKTFEKENLEECLRISMNALSKIVTVAVILPKEGEYNTDSHHTSTTGTATTSDVAKAVVQANIDIIGWEFGGGDWMHLPSSQTLTRPPVEWNQYLVQPDFIGAVFSIHEKNLVNTDLAHTLRQLLLLLCSLSGPVFRQKEERTLFAQFLCEGTRTLPSLFHRQRDAHDASLIYDVFSLVSKLITNFRLVLLSDLPSFIPLLESLAATGRDLLQANLQECESVQGELDSMQHQDWREEAISLLVEAIALLCQDPWLNDAKSDQVSRQSAQQKLMQTLGPLFSEFVRCRTRMTYLAEKYSVKEDQTSDEEKEGIEALAMEEELKVVACLGRLHLPSALATISSAFQEVIPRLQSVWKESDGSTPDAAALLKECSLLLKYVGHLLTDENKRDMTLRVPPSIEVACRMEENLLNDIAFMIRGVLSLMHVQGTNVATSPSNLRLSSDLSRQFLWFLTRWAPVYVCGAVNDNDSSVLQYWSRQETSQEVVDFCIWLCSQYQCFLPQETRLQESVAEFLVSCSKGNPRLRSAMVRSPNFHQMVILECLCMRPCLSLGDLGTAISAKNLPVSVDMLQGCYCRSIETKAQLLTAILVASGDSSNDTSNQIFNECIRSVQETFMTLISLSEAESPDTRILARACVALLGDVANAAAHISDPGRVPTFLSPIFPRLSNLMEHFADDLLICEGLLRLFRDYTRLCFANLDHEQTATLLEATSSLLKSYSKHHCTSRVVRPKTGKETKEEEDQAYSDILCTIELLMSLARGGANFPFATDVVFLGLQQIIPLMTQGLLTYPALCLEYFSLVSFMMEAYADRIFALPYELIHALIQSLLKGSTHHETRVAKKCLNGIQGLATAQLKTGSLTNHLMQNPDLFERCTKHVLREIVFQQSVFDRMDSTSDALLILIALDQNKFAAVVNELGQSVCSQDQQKHLAEAYRKLVQHEVISNALRDGWEGRANRRRFKEDLEEFVNATHSFLVVK